MQECRPFRALCTLLLFSQGFISGFALILPWALQEYRPFRALCRIGCVSPGFHIGLRLISPWAMQECRPFRARCRIGCLRCCVVVLCSLNVFGCVNGLLCLVVYLFDFDCIVCGIGGIDLCGRAMSPNGAILPQSPGRKPWVNHCNTFIEPLQGRHFLTQGCVWSLCCIYSLGHWLAKVSAAPTELNLLLSVFPQGFISGFALILPWALRGCRPCRALCRIGCLRSCVVVLCSLNVFGGCKMDCCVRSCYCICLIVLFVGLIGVVGQ